jgi:hypothetical protein
MTTKTRRTPADKTPSGPQPEAKTPQLWDKLPHATALSPAPALRAQKLHLMLGEFVARGVGYGAATAAVLPMSADPGVWAELQAMQQSVVQRLQKQHQGWIEGFAALAQDYAGLRQANTLSKYVEREYNLVAQFGALVSDQAAQLAGLMENIQVDYGYWIAQQQEKQKAG